MHRKFLLWSLVVISACSFSQGFIVKEFTGSDTGANYSENLGDILVSGYLNNEIKAYAFAYSDSVLKFKPLIAPNWEPNKIYFANDTVLFKGKYYKPQYDLVRENIPPDSLSADIFLRWSNVLPKAISLKYFFPELEDTLPKPVFLKRVVAYPPQIFDAWEKSYSYYANDIVSYKGINYECIEDNSGISPDNKDYWLQTSRGGILFFLPSELS
jgi:hypothetical protein